MNPWRFIIGVLLMFYMIAGLVIIFKGFASPECQLSKETWKRYENALLPIAINSTQPEAEYLIMTDKTSRKIVVIYDPSAPDMIFKIEQRGSHVLRYYFFPADLLNAKVCSLKPGASLHVFRGCPFSGSCGNGFPVSNNLTKVFAKHIQEDMNLREQNDTRKFPEVTVTRNLKDKTCQNGFLFNVTEPDVYFVVVQHRGPAPENFVRFRLNLSRTYFVTDKTMIQYCAMKLTLAYSLYLVTGVLACYTYGVITSLDHRRRGFPNQGNGRNNRRLLKVFSIVFRRSGSPAVTFDALARNDASEKKLLLENKGIGLHI